MLNIVCTITMWIAFPFVYPYNFIKIPRFTSGVFLLHFLDCCTTVTRARCVDQLATEVSLHSRVLLAFALFLCRRSRESGGSITGESAVAVFVAGTRANRLVPRDFGWIWLIGAGALGGTGWYSREWMGRALRGCRAGSWGGGERRGGSNGGVTTDHRRPPVGRGARVRQTRVFCRESCFNLTSARPPANAAVLGKNTVSTSSRCQNSADKSSIFFKMAREKK